MTRNPMEKEKKVSGTFFDLLTPFFSETFLFTFHLWAHGGQPYPAVAAH
jgi:hypothetical protein